jgi:hypothetical protein
MIKRFNDEVLAMGAEYCLPSKLTGEWLDWLSIELEFLQLEDVPEQKLEPPSCALSAVFKILMYKSGEEKVEISEEELFNKMGEFLTEIEIEKVSRRTDIRLESATMETIFTNRNVKVWRES